MTAIEFPCWLPVDVAVGSRFDGDIPLSADAEFCDVPLVSSRIV